MSDNHYTPPEAVVADQAPLPGSPVKAIALGMLVDIGGTIAVGSVISIVYAIVLAQQGMTQEQVMEAMQDAPILSTYGLISTVVGLAFSVLGGYVCARIVKRSELRMGAIMAAISTVLGLLLSGGETSAPKIVTLLLLGITAVMVGAWQGRLKNWRLANPPAP
jgi:hypothetical protein